ncbi:uncharacterized protein LOC114351240 [Ostrinia furnacalis]|uniref:uncharacterized protein LOC114351240 n=1 Tax=Ostrinia furnacalis TaxID=93504 RepID=UPI00103E462C|nr:uncharacterized protein LOC114351240 [Ostrinia furnacalis]
MFIARLKPLYYISDKIVVRNLRNSRIVSPPANPGLSRRIKAFKEDGLKIEDDDPEEFIERSDSDFKNVGEAYNEHMNETLIGKYELRHQIVKDKYFKENMPNLLTWSEKEQIRHLANTEPDEWTPERLAESFPVTASTVKKILKYPWKPATEERIARHDASVMRNWRELKEGSLSISEEIRQHFLKFSDRTIPPLNAKSIKIDVTQDEKMGEFEQIIRRCANKETADNTEEDTTNQETEVEEFKHKKQFKDKKLMTLDQLKDKIKNRLDSGNEVDINDEIIANTVSSKSVQTKSDLNNEIELPDVKNESKAVTGYKENTQNEKNIMDYPERIRIPKKAYKKGATYKVNDCYYDHDGRFLYRVLGMSNN